MDCQKKSSETCADNFLSLFCCHSSYDLLSHSAPPKFFSIRVVSRTRSLFMKTCLWTTPSLRLWTTALHQNSWCWNQKANTPRHQSPRQSLAPLRRHLLFHHLLRLPTTWLQARSLLRSPTNCIIVLFSPSSSLPLVFFLHNLLLLWQLSI